MTEIPPGWYKDPADPATQRWWDGEGWLGDPLPSDAAPPPGPPAVPPPAPPVPVPVGTPGRTSDVPAPAGGPAAPPGVPGARPGAAPGVPGMPGTVASPMGWPYPMVAPRPHGLMLAGPGSRFMARFVDGIFVLVLAAIANVWFAIEFWRDFKPVWTWAMTQPVDFDHVPSSVGRASEMLVLMSVVLTAVWFAYEVPASANSGQTLGKRIFGIKIVRVEADERLGFGRSFRRWFRLAWPTPFWIACYGLPLLLQVIDCLFVVSDRRLHQALHDRIAATLVIQVPRPSRPETARTPADTGWPGMADQTRLPQTGDDHVDPR